jgi:hypothetical protein
MDAQNLAVDVLVNSASSFEDQITQGGDNMFVANGRVRREGHVEQPKRNEGMEAEEGKNHISRTCFDL